jgi:hypothetical protein
MQLAERVGFGLSPIVWILQLTDSTRPTLPRMPTTPWRIARHLPAHSAVLGPVIQALAPNSSRNFAFLSAIQVPGRRT